MKFPLPGYPEIVKVNTFRRSYSYLIFAFADILCCFQNIIWAIPHEHELGKGILTGIYEAVSDYGNQQWMASES